MHGVRDQTDDLDIDCSAEVYRSVMAKPAAVKNAYVNENGANDCSARFANIYSCRVSPFPDLETIMIDGVCVYSISELLNQKEMLNRPKDQADIKGLMAKIK